MGVNMSIMRSIGSIFTRCVAAFIVLGLLVVVKAGRFLLMKTNFSTAPWLKAFLNLEWINPIVEKFLSEDAVGAAMLNSLTAIFCKSGH